MAQQWSTGGALIYAGPWASSAGQAQFLGTCTDKPDIDIEKLYEEAPNDLAGMDGMDSMYGGKRASIVLDVDRMNYPVYLALTSAPNFSAALTTLPGLGGFPLIDQPGDVGALEFAEGLAYILYIVFPYAAKPAMGALAPAGMVPGYRFLGCRTDDTKVISGTTPHRAILAITAKRVFFPGVSNALGAGQFVLGDFNVVGLPPIN